jgi:hypothetical protein
LTLGFTPPNAKIVGLTARRPAGLLIIGIVGASSRPAVAADREHLHIALAHCALNNWGQDAFKYMKHFVVADGALVLGVGNIWPPLLLGSLLLSRGLASDSQRPTGSPQSVCEV